ncbi:hypothetical protein WA026_015587 [Henosepilachna vigintioctopunctata]|uniref:MD-2-related lipid-recognition domain-containing protein n=1 Tax=Henosepilachna vigintioctopunctata TaxID=420089 RepID=A0AAW1VE86_9CUCU
MFSSIVKVSTLVILLNCLWNVQCVYWYDCEDIPTVGKVEAVKIPGCEATEESSRCRLKRGTNMTFSVTFKSDVPTDTLKAVVHGVVFGEERIFKLPNDNGCVDSGITCPIAKDSLQTYTTSLPVKRYYPKVSVDVKWELQNKEGKDIWCIMVPSKLS